MFSALLLCTLICCLPQSAWAATQFSTSEVVYAGYYRNDGVYTLVFQTSREPRDQYGEFLEFQTSVVCEPGNCHCADDASWRNYDLGRFVTRVVFESAIAPHSLKYWFSYMRSLESVDLSLINYENVNDAAYLFQGCTKLQSVQLGSWNAAGIMDVSGVFKDCSSLKSISLKEWACAAAIADAGEMFAECSELEEVDLSGWKLNGVTDVRGMFKGCASLRKLHIQDAHFGSVRLMAGMFDGCASLENLDVSLWKVGQCIEFREMFRGCEKLKSLNVSKWDTGRVSDARAMFEGCSSLANVDIGNWAGIPRIARLFSGCVNLQKADFSRWRFASHSSLDFEEVFSGCHSLTEFGAPAVGDFRLAFSPSDGEVYWRNAHGVIFEQSALPANCADVYVRTEKPLEEEKPEEVPSKPSAPVGDKPAGTDESDIRVPSGNQGANTSKPSVRPALPTPSKSKDQNHSMQAASVRVSNRSLTYSGKARRPKVVVSIAGKKLVAGKDYKLVWKNNKKVGTAKVTVVGKGKYRGKKTLSFEIVPKGTSVAKVNVNKRGKGKKATITWKKQSKQVTGYQIRYATDKKFAEGAKTKTIKGANKTQVSLSKLKAGKKYYVQVRTYKQVGKKKFVSNWSKAKTFKIKCVHRWSPAYCPVVVSVQCSHCSMTLSPDNWRRHQQNIFLSNWLTHGIKYVPTGYYNYEKKLDHYRCSICGAQRDS